MINPPTILTFGKYKGLLLSDPTIPIVYIKWLASRGVYYRPDNQFETDWKVPIELSILSRREWERRTGDRWEG